jgi:murein DD-endopeptidase MepM/ murein hydrolase activator NlpD
MISLIVMLGVNDIAYAANKKFIEPDETDTNGTYSSPAIKNGMGKFTIHSPYRKDGDATTSIWKTIVGMYNEPRSNTSMHLGVDIGAALGTPIYPAHGSSSLDTNDYAKVHTYGDSSGYGKFVIVDHRDNVDGTNYYFYTIYAHMSEVTKKSGEVKYTDVLGKTGCTGHCYGDHVHLEFRTKYATATDGATRRHPPATFYYGKAPSPWWLDTSHITRMGDNGNCVRFRTVNKHADGYYKST